MGRRAAELHRHPVLLATQLEVMPPVPLPPRPPKKRYLLENPPVRPGFTQDPGSDGVPPATTGAPVAPSALLQLDDPANNRVFPPEVNRLPIAAPPNGLNGNHCGALEAAAKAADEQPLNLSTSNNANPPSSQEVHLSNIVDRVVETMLWKRPNDSARSGDPLRAWFSNEFETRQRSEGSSSSGNSPGGGAGRPHSASPRLAGVDKAPGDGDEEQEADPDRDRLSHGSGGLLEVTIGMSETISRVIDNVYRQESAAAAALPGRRGSAPVVMDAELPALRRRVPVTSQERVSGVGDGSAATGGASPRRGPLSPRQSGGGSPRRSGAAGVSPRPSAAEQAPSAGCSPAPVSNREEASPVPSTGGQPPSGVLAVFPGSAHLTTCPSPSALAVVGNISTSAVAMETGSRYNTTGRTSSPYDPAAPPVTELRPLRISTHSPRPGGASPRPAGSPGPSASAGGPGSRPAGVPRRTATPSPSRRGRKRCLPSDTLIDTDGKRTVGVKPGPSKTMAE